MLRLRTTACSFSARVQRVSKPASGLRACNHVHAEGIGAALTTGRATLLLWPALFGPVAQLGIKLSIAKAANIIIGFCGIFSLFHGGLGSGGLRFGHP